MHEFQYLPLFWFILISVQLQRFCESLETLVNKKDHEEDNKQVREKV